MRRDYSAPVAEAVRLYLDSDGWFYSFDREKGVYQFGLGLEGKLKHVSYFIEIGKVEYIVYVTSSVYADPKDPEMTMNMLRFLSRANYGLKNGNFEFDLRDGEIRYKCRVGCSESLPSRETVKESILCPASMFERYGKGIVEIIFGGMPELEAIRMCEGEQKCREIFAPEESEEPDEDSFPDPGILLDLYREAGDDVPGGL